VPKISIKKPGDIAWLVGSDVIPEERRPHHSKGELDGTFCRYFPTEGESLELAEYSFPPDTEIQSHAHTAAEIIYILKGDIHFGSRVCPAGSAIFIDQMVLYGFRSGLHGVTFLNFRGVLGSTLVPKDVYMSTAQAHDTTS
jgi:hypothetical protein